LERNTSYSGRGAAPRIATVSEHLDQLRAVVADMSPAPEAMAPYLAKVREHAYTVADGDVERLEDAGVSEDEIFEQTVATAIAQGLHRLDVAMAVIG
jgi:alkylhydroperoxidase family enzyme